MTNSTTQILVQNVENFKTVDTFATMEAFDAWMTDNSEYGIVTLDQDADGEYAYIALVAAQSGPDYIMDNTTGEMEAVEDIDPQAELAAKMDIMMELDMNDVAQEDILAMLADEPLAPVPAPVEDIIADPQPSTVTTPKKPRKAKTQSNKGAKMRNFEILAAFITANPGVSRTDVFQDPGLLTSLRTGPQMQAIADGDKPETKRWNRRLNFLIREMRRQNVDIQIERKGRVAHYTIGAPSGQLELPFTPAAETRNSAIIGNNDSSEVLTPATPIGFTRADDETNVSLSFDDLLSTLDDDYIEGGSWENKGQ